MNTIIISAYFNPIHPGHIDLVAHAAALGRVITIVNNDEQVKLKNSVPFMDEQSRLEVVKGLRWTDKIYLSIDQDLGVAKTLKKIMKDEEMNEQRNSSRGYYFLNSGDRTPQNANLQEIEMCEKYGIKPMYIFDKKRASSRELIKKAYEYISKNHETR
jgi:cytidyltransferase-like protein